MPVDKNWTLNVLRHNRNSALLGLASMALLRSSAADDLRGNIVVLSANGDVIFGSTPSDRQGKRFDVDLTQIANELGGAPERFDHTLREYMRSVRRNLVKESFEAAQAYAKSTSQLPAFRALAFFTFVRLIRNCISHDLHFDFRPAVLSLLPVTYEGVTLDAGLQGQPMREDHLSPWLAFWIHTQLEQFVASH